MAHVSLSIDAIRPLNRWDHSYIQPGWQGSVGDVHCQPRLKHSAPELPIRWEQIFAHENEVFLGSNVQDGQHANSSGAMARINDSNWQSGRSFKTRRGWVIEDIRAPDNLVEPYVSSLGDYTWRDKIATVYEARRTGDQFLPVPGQYILHPGEIARGGQTVRVTDVVGGDEPPNVDIGSSVMLNNGQDQQQTNGTQEAPIPTGAYGRSQGASQGVTTGSLYSSRLNGQPQYGKMR